MNVGSRNKAHQMRRVEREGKGQVSIVHYLRCKELNIFLASAGKFQKSLTTNYGMSDKKGSQLGVAAGVQVRNSCYCQRKGNKDSNQGTQKRIHWVW